MAILPQSPKKKNGGARPGSGRKPGVYSVRYDADGRTCTGCETWKPWSEFIKSSRMPGSYWPRCKGCFKLYRDANKEKIREWRRTHGEVIRTNQQNYQAKKKGNGGRYTAREWRALCAWFGNVCVCCGESTDLSVDHIVPVSQGGRNDISNLQPLCMPCNTRKATQTIDYRDPVRLTEFLNSLNSQR